MRSHTIEDFGRVGYGTNGIKEAEVIKTAIQQGYRLFDTADLYDNSDVIANAVNASGVPRNEFYINYKISPKLGKTDFIHQVDEAVTKFGYVDCLMLHDMMTNPGAETPAQILESLRPYVEAGKIRCLGLSNVSSYELQLLKEKFPDITVVQNKFSHIRQDEDVRRYCQSAGISYMGYGLFGGRELNASCSYQFFVEESAWNCSAITYPEFNSLCASVGKSPYEGLLCWSLQQGTIQIPGSTNTARMAENFAAASSFVAMSNDNQEKLNRSLHMEAPANKWEAICAAAHDDRLTQLKKIVGKNQARHRLLDHLYQEENLKTLLDLIYDNVYMEGNIVANEKIQRFMRGQLTMTLCHFMEENLKAGEQPFEDSITLLRKMSLGSQSESDKKELLKLIGKLGAQSSLDKRLQRLKEYATELNYFREHGYFTVKELLLPKLPRGQSVECVSLALLGPNQTIYVLKPLPRQASLKDISELLAEHFPDDFKDKQALANFYIPQPPDGCDKHLPATKKWNLLNLDFTMNSIYGLSQQEDCVRLKEFYHELYQQPKFFNNGQPIVTKQVNADSASYQQLLENLKLSDMKISLIMAKNSLFHQKERLQNHEQELKDLHHDKAASPDDLREKEEMVAASKEAYDEANDDLKELEKSYKASRAAFKLRLEQQQRSKAGKSTPDSQQQPNKKYT